MTHLRRIAIVFLVLAVVLGTGGFAAASFYDTIGQPCQESVDYLIGLGVISGFPDATFRPGSTITRAEAAKIMILIRYGSSALADLLRGAVPFLDVPGWHWASGFIALAKNIGIINGFPDGTFRPEGPVTYAQYAKMLVEAAGLWPTPGLAWPLNYLDAAQRAGMLGGIAGFSADLPALRGDCARMTAFTVREVNDPATGRTLAQSVFREGLVAVLTITPETATVAVGSAVVFSVAAKDDEGNPATDVTVNLSTSEPTKAAISRTGTFVATAPGAYTVTAEAEGVTATARVTVYGVPYGLKAAASRTKVPANEKSTVTITVEVVDSKGNRVVTDDDTVIELGYYHHDGSNGAVVLGDVEQEVENGVTQFVVTAGSNPDSTDVLEFTAHDLEETRISITAVDQVETSLQLTANPTELMANEVDFGEVTAVVLDQDGQRMLYGVFTLTFSISGPGLLEGDTHSVAVVTSGQEATVGISSEKGDPGTIRVSARGEDLRSGSVSIVSYVAGTPRSLKVTTTDVQGEVGEDDDMEVTVAIVDRYGRPTVSNDDVTVEFECSVAAADWDGSVHDIVIPEDDSRATLAFHGQTKGSFKFTVRDAAGELTSTSFQCTVAAGGPATIVLTPDGDPMIYLPVGSPNISLTAQIQDGYGNPCPKSGVVIDFDAVQSVPGKGTGTFSPDDEVKTDSSGKATVTLRCQGYVGAEYTVTADATFCGPVSTAADGIVIADMVPGRMTIAVKNDHDQSISRVLADADEWAYVTITVQDSHYNDVGEGFLVKVEFTGAGVNVRNVTDTLPHDNHMAPGDSGVYTFETDHHGEVGFEFEGAKAGRFTIKATALNVLSTVTASKSFETKAGTKAVGAKVFTSAGGSAEEVDYDADHPVAVRISLVDNGGNAMMLETDTVVYVVPDNMKPGSEYRLTSSGSEVTQVTVGAGHAYKSAYYVDDSHEHDVDLSDDVSLNKLLYVGVNPDFDNTNPRLHDSPYPYAHEVLRVIYGRKVGGNIRIVLKNAATGNMYMDSDWVALGARDDGWFEWSYRDDMPAEVILSVPECNQVWASDDTIVAAATVVTWTVTLDAADGATYVLSGNHTMTAEDVKNCDHLDFEGARTGVEVDEVTDNDGGIEDPLVITTGNHVFAADIAKADVIVNNLPAGLDYTVDRTSETKLTVTFTGHATNHEDHDDVTNASVTVKKEKISYGGTALHRDLTTESFKFDFNN